MAATNSTGGEGPRVVDVNSLSIEELSSLKNQLDAELSFFSESAAELRSAANKFGRCQSTVDSVNPDEKGKEALIPLSESVYIKARLPDPDKFLVEIGTGYYVEMDKTRALDYFKRKYAFLEGQLDTICRRYIPEKQQVRQTIMTMLQKKIQEISLSTAT